MRPGRRSIDLGSSVSTALLSSSHVSRLRPVRAKCLTFVEYRTPKRSHVNISEIHSFEAALESSCAAIPRLVSLLVAFPPVPFLRFALYLPGCP